MKKWVCNTCGYIWDGQNPPNKCPKCDAPKELFSLLTDKEAELIEHSRVTNDLLIKLETVMNKVIELSEKGIKDNLDATSVRVFNMAKSEAYSLRQSIKAEIQSHIISKKWG